ncbi:MAG: chloride channel protein [Bacteroidales bacterium]|nr:chloride channel protein [Bacteroidales bacterium]
MWLKSDNIYTTSIAVGTVSGIICVAFRYTVAQATSIRPLLFNHNNAPIAHFGVFCSIYIALLITRILILKYPKISGSGLPQTQSLIFGKRVYNKPFLYLWVKFIGGVLTLCSGLSLGREGTSVQMGSLIGYTTGNLFKTGEGKKRHLIAAGAGAGVAAAFTAPLSSSILIMESLQRVTISTTIICTLLAGSVAGIISKLLTPYNIYGTIPVASPETPLTILLPIFLIMSLFFALFGKLFSNMLLKGKDLYARWKLKMESHNSRSAIFKEVFILAAATWTMGLFFTDMIGGDQTFLVRESVINTFLAHNIADSRSITSLINIVILFAVTIAIWSFTILSHSSGFPGGIFLPMMTVGGLLGKLFYDILCFISGTGLIGGELDGYFILLGMSAFFIAVMRTPITGFILISEMTNHYETFFPTLIIGTLVYYFTQLLNVKPLNSMLYDFMIAHDSKEPALTTIYIDIEEKSYLNGLNVNKLSLPDGCTLKEITRNKKSIPITASQTILKGDQIGIEINSNDIEKVYRSIITLGSEY